MCFFTFETKSKNPGHGWKSGSGSHLQSGLGETMLHVIGKLIQWTIIENKWDMNRNTGRLSRFIFVAIKYHIWSKNEKQEKSTKQFPSIMKWLK